MLWTSSVDHKDTTYFNGNVRWLMDVVPDKKEAFENLKSEVDWKEMIWRTGRRLPRLCKSSVQTTPIGSIIYAWVKDFFQKTMGIDCHISDIFGNNYRNGEDYLPDHSDNYSSFNGRGYHVVSLSFGAKRLFRFKEGGKVSGPKFYLDAGDILIFSPEQNKRTTHGIPKQNVDIGQRINLTCFCHFEKGNPYTAKFHRDKIPSLSIEEPVGMDCSMDFEEIDFKSFLSPNDVDFDDIDVEMMEAIINSLSEF